MHCPVLMHASKTQYPLYKRQTYHCDVMNAFKDDKDYQNKFPEFSKFGVFDQAMTETGGKILGLITFQAGDVEESESIYFPFYDVPEKTNYHWWIENVHKFETAISGHRGNIGFLRVGHEVQQEIINTLFAGNIQQLYKAVDCVYPESEVCASLLCLLVVCNCCAHIVSPMGTPWGHNGLSTGTQRLNNM